MTERGVLHVLIKLLYRKNILDDNEYKILNTAMYNNIARKPIIHKDIDTSKAKINENLSKSSHGKCHLKILRALRKKKGLRANVNKYARL